MPFCPKAKQNRLHLYHTLPEYTDSPETVQVFDFPPPAPSLEPPLPEQ